MRSYYEHLETTAGVAKKVIISKPVFRSSAIFPVIHQTGISSRILFMGYWILKRHIKQISAVISLRGENGELLHRDLMAIEEAKTYRLELADQLIKSGLPIDASFIGTMEVEFFSTSNLVFPYPAVVINYYGPHFSSVVHTAQRVYNDFEDMHNNSQAQVPESGFNIYADDEREPFFGLINGPEKTSDGKIFMQFFNSDQEVLSIDFDSGPLQPYQLQMIYPAQLANLKKFLKGKVGAAKIRFQVNWIFPRLVAGNFQHSLPAMTITHTYYDCSNARSQRDYWLPVQPEWHPAALMVPACIQEKHFTNLYFYPIYSPGVFSLDVEIYDAKGHFLGRKKNVLKIESPNEEFKVIDIKDLCAQLKINAHQELAARVIARTVDDNRIPARIKLGLDIGREIQQMPCNICTNLQPFNPALETKPSTFRWCPVLADQPHASLWIMNSSPAVHYAKNAEVTLSFFREKDTSVLMRSFTLPPHGFIVIRPDADPDLKNFFAENVGWCTLVSTNPYTTSYYFSENSSGVVGGDHSF